jgi:hypothetical protein
VLLIPLTVLRRIFSGMKHCCACGLEYLLNPKEIPLLEEEEFFCECGRRETALIPNLAGGRNLSPLTEGRIAGFGPWPHTAPAASDRHGSGS